MQTNTTLKAIREIVRQFEHIPNEDEFEKKSIETIEKVYSTSYVESEILFFLAYFGSYVRPLDNEDFTISWCNSTNTINVSIPSNGDYYKVNYEFKDNLEYKTILDAIERIDADLWKIQKLKDKDYLDNLHKNLFPKE